MISVNCPHCGSNARVTHSDTKSNKIKHLYADCTNKECYARFVVRMSYSHDITPSLATQYAAIHEMLANMNPTDRKNLLNQYQQPSFNF
ncbi:ogr/Delta-like zinc finger family protein [Lentisphaerota bacterium WC36G]|nr:ogr/Delta-like zinc finger family protein [Lentisphaerae bacterium WC36]